MDSFDHSKIADTHAVYVLCFPKAGGATQDYHEWGKLTSGNLVFLPVTLPGHEKRMAEKPFQLLKPLVNSIVFEMRRYTQYQFAFYGDCFGGLLAYEIAGALYSTYGYTARKLFVRNAKAPSICSRENHSGTKETDKEFTERLIAEEAVPSQVAENAELLSVLLPGLRADYDLFDNYRWQEKDAFPFPICIFHDLSANLNRDDIYHGWEQMSIEEIQRITYCGSELEFPNKFIVSKIESLV